MKKLTLSHLGQKLKPKINTHIWNIDDYNNVQKSVL